MHDAMVVSLKNVEDGCVGKLAGVVWLATRSWIEDRAVENHVPLLGVRRAAGRSGCRLHGQHLRVKLA